MSQKYILSLDQGTTSSRALLVGPAGQIRGVAQTEFTRGQMTYLAGLAELQSGDVEAAHAYFVKGMEETEWWKKKREVSLFGEIKVMEGIISFCLLQGDSARE